ncbi:hypothetical protein JOM56_009154 [Amanita muscaria]
MTLLIEKALIRNQWPATLPSPTEASPASTKLAYNVVQGRFREVLTSPAVAELFQVQTSDGPLTQVFGLLSKSAEGEEEEITRLVVAIALVHAFIQENWTGPGLDFGPSDILPSTLFGYDGINSKSIAELAYGGEPAYHLSKYPVYLRLAQIILMPGGSYGGTGVSNLTRLKTAPWWVLRLVLLHQQILDEPIPPPEQFLSALVASVESIIATFSESNLDPDLSTRILLDQGLLSHTLSQDKATSSLFDRAVQASGLQYELTGVPGKRTKFQQQDLSQLVVLAESRLNSSIVIEHSLAIDTLSESEPTEENEAGPTLPKTLALNDDTLLETTRYSSNTSSTSLSHIDPSSQPPLHPLDQAVLLALNLNLTATSPSSDLLTSSQSSAYISRVLSHPLNWSIHTMALLSRSRLEANRTRTVERAVLQIQALVDQMLSTDEQKEGKTERDKGASVRERLEYFWEILLPSRWALEKELADKFFSIGVLKSSLEIYEKLEMWEQVVKCYSVLEKPENGIEIVKDLLEGRKRETEIVVVDGKATVSKERRRYLDQAREAKLLCLLGDLEPEKAAVHYLRAWDISENTSSRAMRSLGGVYFSQGKYVEAIDCLRKAVKINPLVGRAWFILGCTAMRLEDWEGAREAFTRCVRIDEEDAESWSNLASVYLRMSAAPVSKADELDSHAEEDVAAVKSSADGVSIEHKLLAYRALKQGIKFSYSNWKMWYNYMIVSVDVGELSEVARALGRIVEETSGRSAASSSSGASESNEPMLDLDVVDRLVDAVMKGASGSAEESQAVAADENVQQQRSRTGTEDSPPTTSLGRTVNNLFEATLLPRISSSPRLFHAYAKLMTVQGRWDDALKAYLDAYRVGVAGTWGSSASSARPEDTGESFNEAVREVEETVDLLRNFGPKVESAGGSRWKGQARSIVRTLMARTKEEYEGEAGWVVLVRLLEELKTA